MKKIIKKANELNELMRRQATKDLRKSENVGEDYLELLQGEHLNTEVLLCTHSSYICKSVPSELFPGETHYSGVCAHSTVTQMDDDADSGTIIFALGELMDDIINQKGYDREEFYKQLLNLKDDMPLYNLD